MRLGNAQLPIDPCAMQEITRAVVIQWSAFPASHRYLAPIQSRMTVNSLSEWPSYLRKSAMATQQLLYDLFKASLSRDGDFESGIIENSANSQHAQFII